MKDLISEKKKKNGRTSNLKKSKVDVTVREVYFSNISKGTAFLLQGLFVPIQCVNYSLLCDACNWLKAP